VIILPAAYLPPLTWWALVLREENVGLEYQETYPRQTFRNRCYIYSANGLLPLSLPVIKVFGNHTLTRDIILDYSKNWQQIHWRSIESAYSKTPYFLYYADAFRSIYFKRFELLTDLNLAFIRLCASLLSLEEKGFHPTSGYRALNDEIDYRVVLHPKKDSSLVGYSVFPRYMQAFEPKHGFLPNLSIIDLLFNHGKDALHQLALLNRANAKT